MFCKQCSLILPSIDVLKYKIPNNFGNDILDKLWIEPCILPEMIFLWENRIKTHACCCGHHEEQPYVLVSSDCEQFMKELGYEKIGNFCEAIQYKLKSV